MLKWVVFDFGGTLNKHFDNERVFNKIDRDISEKFGLKCSKRVFDEVRKEMQLLKGKSEIHSGTLFWRKVYEKCNLKATEKNILKMSEMFSKKNVTFLHLFPDTVEVLSFIKSNGLNMALISNADEMSFRQRLKKSGLKKFFKIAFSSEEVGGEKSSLWPFMLFISKANKFAKVKPEEVLMVGDTIGEDSAAKILGMKTVWIKKKKNSSYWHGLKPDYTIKKLSELKPIIQKL
jgi:HAD superfamily hydrolase (TIGR01549 family)